jgi:LacI family transcriptional regulator
VSEIDHPVAEEAPVPNRPPTMKDVAARAGVGLGTVSRVLSGQGSVSAATRALVETTAAEMNFRPSAIGRGLRRQRSNTIGLMVADITNSFYGEFAEGVLEEARAEGRHVIVCANGESTSSELEYIDLLLEERVDAIIAFPVGANVAAWRNAEALGTGLVFADRTLPGVTAPSVTVDNRAAMRNLTGYLLDLGHRRIGYLGGPLDRTSGLHREQGFIDAHEERGVPIPTELVIRSQFTRETSDSSARELFDLPLAPTAVIASNNVLGEAVLRVLRERDLTVPGDVSFVMFDDVPWARIVSPPVTVVAQPAREMGRAAARLAVLAGAGRPPGRTRGAVATSVYEAPLILRQSAGPYRP